MALCVRAAVQDFSDDHKWVISDGPVDALWIENMNTVLDDNKMLCLANSERIKLTPSIHMMFEVKCSNVHMHSLFVIVCYNDIFFYVVL